MRCVRRGGGIHFLSESGLNSVPTRRQAGQGRRAPGGSSARTRERTCARARGAKRAGNSRSYLLSLLGRKQAASGKQLDLGWQQTSRALVGMPLKIPAAQAEPFPPPSVSSECGRPASRLELCPPDSDTPGNASQKPRVSARSEHEEGVPSRRGRQAGVETRSPPSGLRKAPLPV